MNKLIQLFFILILYVYFSYNINFGCNIPSSHLCTPKFSGKIKPSYLHRSYRYNPNFYVDKKLKIDYNQIPPILLLSLGIILSSWLCYLNICRHVNYVSFNIALNLHCKEKRLPLSFQKFWVLLLLMMLGFLASEYPQDLFLCIFFM